jgi:hypothetical protein
MASMDQPRVSLILRRTPDGPPLAAKQDVGLAQLLGDKDASDTVATFAAFLDTGASGVMLSAQTAQSLGVQCLPVDGKPNARKIIFHDVGVGGTDQFNVSEPLYISWGAYAALGGSVAEGSFIPVGGPWNCQIGPLGGGGLLEAIMGGIDVIGMPAMAGKIVVLDPKPVNTFEDVMRVRILNPNDRPAPQIPATNRHVALSYGNFGPFTYTDPASAQKPVITSNPFIGPAPVDAAGAKAAPITLRFGDKTSQAGWLLDTGAAASMISTRQAAALGIRYKEGTEGSGSPVLEGVPLNKQFTLTVGGIGGSKKAAGFFVDELRVPTAEGDDLVYKPAPVLVNDITVEHPTTHQEVTLDGVFGMNFLVASAHITEGIAPDIGNMAEGPYDLIVIDHVKGILGLELRKQLLGGKSPTAGRESGKDKSSDPESGISIRPHTPARR